MEEISVYSALKLTHVLCSGNFFISSKLIRGLKGQCLLIDQKWYVSKVCAGPVSIVGIHSVCVCDPCVG